MCSENMDECCEHVVKVLESYQPCRVRRSIDLGFHGFSGSGSEMDSFGTREEMTRAMIYPLAI